MEQEKRGFVHRKLGYICPILTWEMCCVLRGIGLHISECLPAVIMMADTEMHTPNHTATHSRFRRLHSHFCRNSKSRKR